MAQTSDIKTKEEGDAIQGLATEISKGEGGYKSYNTGTAMVRGKQQIVFSGVKQDMFSLSIDQLHASSKLSPFDHNRVFAAGKYQIITDNNTGTLLSAKAAMKLSGSEKFTPELQESILIHYLLGPTKRPPLYNYIHYGIGTLDDAVYAASKEWASIQVPKGRKRKNGSISSGKDGYYGGANSAKGGSGAAIAQKIQAARAAYAQAQSGGGAKLPDKPTPLVDEEPVTTKTTETKPETKPDTKPDTKTDTKPDTKTETTEMPATAKTPDEYRGYHLTGSVGLGGKNHHDDVVAVQARLGFFGIHTKTDGRYGPDTLAAIKQFQKAFGIHDGLIDVGKKTQKELFSGEITVEAKLDDPTTTTTSKPDDKPEKTPETKPEKKPTKPEEVPVTGGGAAQMSKLLAVASGHARGKTPDHKCYSHVKEYIREAGGYGNIRDVQHDKRFDGAIGAAHDFADRVNSVGPAKFGLEKLAISTPFEAPDGAIIVVRAGTPGTSDPAAGDITVAGPGTEFYNGGVMHYHGPAAWPPKRGGLIGAYKPK